jgi:hypothetical protein
MKMNESIGFMQGSSLLEALLALSILSTVLLSLAFFGFRQIKVMRDTMLLNQLFMQFESFTGLKDQHPEIFNFLDRDWQENFQKCIPYAIVNIDSDHQQNKIEIAWDHHTLDILRDSNGNMQKRERIYAD